MSYVVAMQSRSEEGSGRDGAFIRSDMRRMHRRRLVAMRIRLSQHLDKRVAVLRMENSGVIDAGANNGEETCMLHDWLGQSTPSTRWNHLKVTVTTSNAGLWAAANT